MALLILASAWQTLGGSSNSTQDEDANCTHSVHCNDSSSNDNKYIRLFAIIMAVLFGLNISIIFCEIIFNKFKSPQPQIREDAAGAQTTENTDNGQLNDANTHSDHVLNAAARCLLSKLNPSTDEFELSVTDILFSHDEMLLYYDIEKQAWELKDAKTNQPKDPKEFFVDKFGDVYCKKAMMSEFNRRDGVIRNLRRHRYANDENASVKQNDFVTFDCVMEAMQSISIKTKQLIPVLEACPSANSMLQRV